MNNEIKCENCGEDFLPKSEKNIFCSRKCFKKNYYHRLKKEAVDKYPAYTCPTCCASFLLTFDPTKEYQKFKNILCPFCSTLMINVCDSLVAEDEPTESSDHQI